MSFKNEAHQVLAEFFNNRNLYLQDSCIDNRRAESNLKIGITYFLR
jgi:hypothetical protein